MSFQHIMRAENYCKCKLILIQFSTPIVFCLGVFCVALYIVTCVWEDRYYLQCVCALGVCSKSAYKLSVLYQ